MPKDHKKNTSTKARKGPAPMIESSLTIQETDNSITVQESGIKMEDNADISQEKAGIISIVKDLEEQVEMAFKLKEALEADLDETQKKLSEESAVRTRLEGQVKSLEVQADLADQLRQDISFAEQERNKFASLLEEIKPQLRTVTQERDLLTEKVASAEAHSKDLMEEKTTLEAQAMNLKDKVADIGRLRKELEETAEARQNLEGKFNDANARMENLRVELDQQQTTNRDLIKSKVQLESEIKKINLNLEAAKNEIEAFKKAFRDIHSEATLTSGRVRQRYFKPKNKE